MKALPWAARLAGWGLRRPRLALLLWALLLGLSGFLAKDLGQLLYGSVGVLPDSQAAQTEVLLARDFDGAFAQFLLVVLEGPSGGPEAQAQAQVEAAASQLQPLLAAQPFVQLVRRMPEASPRHAVLVLGLNESRVKGSERHVAPLRALLRQALPTEGPVRPMLTGQAPFSLDLVGLANQQAGQTEAKVLPFTLVALVLAFGALGAAALPLLAGVAAVVLALGVVSLFARHMEVTVYATNLVSMLGLGLGIDYALFMVARLREEGEDMAPDEALQAALAHVAPAIALSAGTVCLGLLGLATAPAQESRGLGLGGTVVAFTSAAAAIGLMPLLAQALGPWLGAPRWLSTRLASRGPSQRWGAWARVVLRWPKLALLLALALLLPMAWPLTRLELGDPDPVLLPASLESVQAVQTLRGMGQSGALIPFRLVLTSEDGGPILKAARLPALARLAEDLKAHPQVAQVVALVNGDRLGRVGAALALRGEAALRASLPEEARGLVSRDGRALAITVLLNRHQGISEARAFARELKGTVWAKAHPDLKAQVLLAGPAMQSQEFVDSAHRVYPWVLGFMTLAIGLVMGLATRSVALALKALFANAITVAAAIGATWWLVQDPWVSQLLGLAIPATTVPAGIPLLAACVVFGLSMDYEVFLLSRIQEGHRAGLSDPEAIEAAVARSGGVITTAAVIMAMVFLGFALTPFFPIKILGLALLLGVLLDATVVRLLLVPSLMALMGRWNWWPGEALPAPEKL